MGRYVTIFQDTADINMGSSRIGWRSCSVGESYGPRGNAPAQWRHNAIPRTRIILRRVRVCDPQHFARMLYQSILETASSSGKSRL
jgi:hypothetical protein